MQYNDADLRTILDSNFILNPQAFTAGRRNDDVVDSMCICFAININWDEVWKQHVQHNPIHDGSYYNDAIAEHRDRVEKWLNAKEANGYNRGEYDIMVYAINY